MSGTKCHTQWLGQSLDAQKGSSKLVFIFQGNQYKNDRSHYIKLNNNVLSTLERTLLTTDFECFEVFATTHNKLYFLLLSNVKSRDRICLS